MHLLDPLQKDYRHLCEIFESIYKKNGIALLGAGASVTDKKFLSAELINLYEAKISKSFETNDIIQFVDILQSTPGLRRSDFDSFVVEQLNKLSPTTAHKIFVTIPWKQIITTNFDTLIEEASDFSVKEHNTHYKLHVIRNKNQSSYIPSDDEISYIKLNGCKTDLSLYPLVFSTEDFNKQSAYYKKVTSSYHQFSNDIDLFHSGIHFRIFSLKNYWKR